MKLVKSLLLGSAAGLAAVAGAQAADLPARGKAPAVEYVRVCSAYGAGFFFIPGTETCLRVGGRVRAEALYAEPVAVAGRTEDYFGFRVRGRIQTDARTQTAYGTLRTFVRFELTQSSGTPYGQTGTGSTSAALAQAFVQWGGLTAGKVTSFFSNPDLPTAHMGTLRFDDAPDIALFAYTYSFGNGFSATLSLEDGLARRVNAGAVYGGQTVPDVVANVRYAGTWGSAQLSGAVHQIRTNVAATDSEYGYAIGFQGSVNLPFLGAGDAAWLSAAYADGAISYLGFGSSTGAGRSGFPGSDAYYFVDATGAAVDLRRTKGWSIAGGLTHYWTPQVRSSVFGSYAQLNAPGTITDGREYRVGANTFWSPVSGLNLGVEVLYANVDPSGTGVGRRADSAVEGRIRVQRDF